MVVGSNSTARAYRAVPSTARQGAATSPAPRHLCGSAVMMCAERVCVVCFSVFRVVCWERGDVNAYT